MHIYDTYIYVYVLYISTVAVACNHQKHKDVMIMKGRKAQTGT